MKKNPLKTAFIFFFLTIPIISLAKENAKRKIEKSTYGSHSHDENQTIHKDSKSQHRMGIFHYNEGNRFLKKGVWKEAINNYNMALHHDKTLYQVYINLSTAYLQGKKFLKAFQTLELLNAMQPENPMLHYNLACYHSLIGNTKSALKSLKQATQLGFKNKNQIKNDSDLNNLRKSANFLEWWDKF